MPNNNTENILSTPLTEGTGSPIPASRISFDGTGTSIEATDVQAAITELDTGLQSTKDDVSDIEAELRDKYLFASRGTVSAVGDGTKTFGDILNELATKFSAILSALENDEYVMVQSLSGGYIATSLYPHNMYNKNSVFSSLSFMGLTFTDSWRTMSLHLIRIASSLADCKWLQSNLGSSTQTFSNSVLSSTFTNELTLEMKYMVYKKV